MSYRQSMSPLPPDRPRHSLFDDAQGIVYAALMAGFGIVILTHLGLVTGQTAGLAVLISYATGWSFGAVFFVINIPFYILGWQRIGPGFVARSFIAVALLSALSVWMPQYLSFATLDPILGAVLFGFLTGSALLALFRHGGSLGGIGIVALMLQDRLGWRAGLVQLGFDTLLFAIALTLIPVATVAVSALGALVVNLVIAINHRRDRYIVA